MKEVILADYSGGIAARESSTDFSDRQWSKLSGVVLESGSKVRSQWACQRISGRTDIVDMAVVDGFVFAVTTTGAVIYAAEPGQGASAATTAALTWTTLSAVTADVNLRVLCPVPLRNQSAQGFISGLLLNSTAGTGSAWVLYVDPGTGAPTAKQLADRYPATDTEESMPRAAVGVMWGDFLVLGDVHWLADDAASYTATNTKRYPHALWMAKAGKPFNWDTLDVVFTGVKGTASDSPVHAMIPVDVGLLVLTASGAFLLRGTPDSFAYEELRVGAASASPAGSAWWSASGVATWVDTAGQVWHTNGEQFIRLDDPLSLDRSAGAGDCVEAFGEYLLVVRDGTMYALRGWRETGAWTQLVPPGAVTRMRRAGDSLYMLTGGQLWRFARGAESERGQTDGTAIEVAVATRTLETGDGHQRTWWRQFGVRADAGEGAPRVVSATVRAGAARDVSAPAMKVTLGQPVGSREELVVPGHGPSVEASVEWVFRGDVTVEQVTAWAHDGVESR